MKGVFIHMSHEILVMKQQLEEKEKEFNGTDFMWGPSLLTHPQYISAPRDIMFTSNLKHKVSMVKPETPLLYTNYENIVGNMSSGIIRAKSRRVVTHKVSKFSGDKVDHMYTLFLYDEEEDKYHVVHKKNVEDLTEKFGFGYNTDNMDSKNIGDAFEKDEVVLQSTSYDEYGNYSYGVNATFMYLISNDTIEDAAVISKSFAQKAVSKEVEVIPISINDNDIPVNLFGQNGEYKGFPDIGESTPNVIFARRRLNTKELLHSIKIDNITEPDDKSDTIFYCKGRVTDINIYCNKAPEEMEVNKINAQLFKYVDMQQEYYQNIKGVCEEILDSGSKYSVDITHLYQRAKDILDPEVKWKIDREKAFSNLILEITVERDVKAEVGQKLTGRDGNKGVTSVVREDEDMPILENGKRVDIIFNTLGVINRLNPMQLYEQSITFIMARTAERMGELLKDGSPEDAIDLMVRMVGHFNTVQATKIREFVDKLDSASKVQLINEAMSEGIAINIPPMVWDKSLFSTVRDTYLAEPWIGPYKAYIKKFGRMIEMKNDLHVGQMYIMKLKQTATKGLSVRSTGHISQRGLPEKVKRDSRELYSKTPIRIGGDENNNMNIGVSSDFINMLHTYYRSSVHGRKLLAQLLGVKTEEIDASELTEEMLSDRNVEILEAFSKVLGFRMSFTEPDKTVYLVENKTERLHTLLNGDHVICTEEEAIKLDIRHLIEMDHKEREDMEFIDSVAYDAQLTEEVNRRYEALGK